MPMRELITEITRHDGSNLAPPVAQRSFTRPVGDAGLDQLRAAHGVGA